MLTRAKGFSVIELLVVVSVMALLLAIVIPNLLRFLPAHKLASGMSQVMGDLRLARQKAIAEGNDFVISYPVEADAEYYKVHDNDNSDRPPNEAGEHVLRIRLPSQVEFVGSETFAFKSDGTAIDTDGDPVMAFHVVLKNRRGDRDSVSVLPSGMVMK